MGSFNINLPSDCQFLSSPRIQVSDTKCDWIQTFTCYFLHAAISTNFSRTYPIEKYLFNHTSNIILLHIVVLSPHFIPFFFLSKNIATTMTSASFSLY